MRDWTDAAFLAHADAWVRQHAQPTAELEQVHVQRWATVLRVPTASEPVWFKAVADPAEVVLTAALAAAAPGRTPDLIAHDAGRGWMLLADAGTRLRELVESVDDLWRWERFLPEYGQLQLDLAHLADGLAGAGVPRQPLSHLQEEVANLLDDEPALLLGHDEGLTAEERAALQAALDEVGALAEHVLSLGVPETVQHDDLNDGNVFVRDGRARAWDWGDACVSHPFHSLTVTLRHTAYRLDLEPGGPEVRRLRDAYLEAFGSFGSDERRRGIADVAYRTGTLARALAWYRDLAGLEPDERREDLPAVAYGLRRFLEARPPGAWR